MGIFGRFGMTIAARRWLLAAPAAAENRIFIIANNADGYGIDRCLANGERCGVDGRDRLLPVAVVRAGESFRKIERDEITGAVPTSGKNACAGKLRQLRRDRVLALGIAAPTSRSSPRISARRSCPTA